MLSDKKLNVTKIAATATIPLLLYYGYVAFSWGLADTYARPIINTVQNWKKGELEITQEDWARYEKGLTSSLELSPGNAEFHRYIGSVLEGPYTKFQLGNKEAQASRQMAAERYRKSIELRPTWPYGYANLMLVKFRLLEIDQEFYDAMYAAMEYGPWEPDIQRLIAQIGMVLWKILDTKEREFILEVTRKSFMHANKSHVKTIQAIIERQKFVERVCGSSNQNKQLMQYCLDKQNEANSG